MRENLRVLHQDNHLLVVAKPAGTPVVPDASGDESLLDRAREWIRVAHEKPGRVYLGVVHRLDRPVSGVVCFARTSKAAGRLAEQFRERAVRKLYWGLGDGRPPGREGELEQWLAKDRERNRVRPVSPEQGMLAVTRWRLLRRRGRVSLLELEPRTGRPHQLRVAARTLGLPLLGDLKYGAREGLPDRSVALHAAELELDHPTRGQRMRFECEAPDLACWDIARG